MRKLRTQVMLLALLLAGVVTAQLYAGKLATQIASVSGE